MASIGGNIREALDRAGMSQRQLALRSGMDEAQVSKYVHDRAEPKAISLARLARALGCTTDSLLEGGGRVSDLYLCDTCAKMLDGDHLNTCVCLPSFPREHRKRAMHDHHGVGGTRHGDPHDVCEHYERKEG